MISIITVCYNAENTIRETIESVINQTYKDYEYIIIDGCSTDSTLMIIESYSETFMKRGITYRYLSEMDNGIYDAMNKGIRLAVGDWVGFINADDKYVNKDVLMRVFTDESIKHSDCVYGDTILRYGNVNSYKKSCPIEEITFRNPFVHQSSFAKTCRLREYFFDTRYRYAADYDQFLRMYKDKLRFKRMPFPISEFSLQGESQQHTLKAVKEFEAIRISKGFFLNSIVKRYSIYFAVIIVKSCPMLYKTYVSFMKKTN